MAAADAFALAGDTEGEARALAAGGDVERLEALLSREQSRTAHARAAHDAHTQIDLLAKAGQRREALALAESSPDDPLARSRLTRLRGARIGGPVVRVTLRGKRLTLVLGDEVTIGRNEGTLPVSASALSRKHVRLTRDGARFLVTDLGSRNGTQLRGLNLATPLDVGAGVDLTLGAEVPLALAPSTELDDALAIEVAGVRYVAPLGEAKLGIGSWRLATAPDGWVELVTGREDPPFAGPLELATRVTLLRGDAFSATRGGEVVLRVEE